MFDIGFFEIVLLSVISLVVVGPERLPGVARTLGLWSGRIKRQFQDAKSTFEEEIGADEVRRQLHNEAVLRELDNIPQAMQNLTGHYDHAEPEPELEPEPEPEILSPEKKLDTKLSDTETPNTETPATEAVNTETVDSKTLDTHKPTEKKPKPKRHFQRQKIDNIKSDPVNSDNEKTTKK